MSEFKLDTREEGDVVIITTEGYLNNVGGEKIAEASAIFSPPTLFK